ncbi:nitroreductase [Aquiluna sp.]|nr:nitroreductase [Aquiluna sp.]MDA9010431.1 nitroreductase [Aquiluna sp.]
MDSTGFSEFVASRRTTRDFLPKPVPEKLIDQLIADAMTAPSWSNTRPFMVGIATGERRDRISQEFLNRWKAASDALNSGIWGRLKLLITRYGLPKSDYRVFRPYPKDLKPRQQKVGADLYGFIDISRDDRQARQAQWGRNYEFFGAPVSLFIFTHSGLGEYSVSDAGLFMQNLMLSAHAHGLGSCAQGASALWAEPVRKEFEIPRGYKLLCGIAIGYPTDHKINQFHAERLDIDQIKLTPND